MKIPKKIMSVICMALVVQSILTTSFAVTTSAYEEKINESAAQNQVQKSDEELIFGDFKYSVNDDKVTIIKYTGGDSEVIVPSYIDRKPVISIGSHSFDDFAVGINLESVIIPEGVKNIDSYAFHGCTHLRSITIPDSVTDIGSGAFSSCYNLQNINIPDGIKNIGDYTFAYCSSLESITIPDSVTSIGDYAFDSCSGLINITIPDSVKSIGKQYTFYNCINLTSVHIGNSVTSIGDYAFALCKNLKSVIIPDSVIKIGDEAFSYCDSLKNITISDNVTSIGSFTFNNCLSLKDIIIPDSVTNIGLYAFSKCSNLESIAIPNDVTIINDGVFDDCSNLTSVTISKKVKKISNSAFGRCVSLTDVYYMGTEEQWKSVSLYYGNDYLTNATIHYDCPIISLNKNKITLEVGQTYTLSATVLPKAYDKLTWKSSNKAVATVTSKGKISAKSEGTANITLKTADGKNTSCKVTVVASSAENPNSISLNKSSLIVGVGETFNFSCKTDKGTSAKVTYTSSKTSVATVDSNGNMKAKSAGTAIITATTNNGKTAKCRVTVKNAPTSISINRKNSIMGLGETFYLEGSLANNEASRVLTFSSSKPEVATVSDGGIVMAKSIGTAIVSITTYNGQKATCRVTVKNAPTSLTFNKTSITLKQGESFYLESQFKNGEYARMVTYNSPNKSIATVSGSGVITAKSKGSVQITGKTYNGKTAVCTVTVK